MAMIRVSGVPLGTDVEELKLFFSNSEHGGGTILKIYYPLNRNNAVIIYSNHEDLGILLSEKHIFANVELTILKEPYQLFRTVTVQLQPHVTRLLDQDSSHLDYMQFHGNIEITFDPDSMNYLMVGDWYQMEWAWSYLETVCQKIGLKPKEDKDKPTEASFTVEDSTDSAASSDDEVCSLKDHNTIIQNSQTQKFPLFQPDGKELKKYSFERYRNDLSKPDKNCSTKGETHARKDFTRDADQGENVAEEQNKIPNVVFDADNSECLPSENLEDINPPSEHYWTPKHASFVTGSRAKHPDLLTRGIHGDDYYRRRLPNPYSDDDSDDDGHFPYMLRRFDHDQYSFPHRCVIPPSMHSKRQEMGMTRHENEWEKSALSLDINVGPLDIRIALGNLLLQKTDAIVSPASTDLANQYGVAAAIARAAGKDLDRECRQYIEAHGSLCIGDVIHSCAGGTLDSQVGFILHVAGPTWREDAADQTVHLLTCTYLNCFQYANKQLWLKSISLPPISTGMLGVPLDVSIQAFHDALLLHVHEEENPRHLQNIVLLNNNKESAYSTIAILRSLLDLDEKEAKQAALNRYIDRTREFEFQAKDFSLNGRIKSKTISDSCVIENSCYPPGDNST